MRQTPAPAARRGCANSAVPAPLAVVVARIVGRLALAAGTIDVSGPVCTGRLNCPRSLTGMGLARVVAAPMSAVTVMLAAATGVGQGDDNAGPADQQAADDDTGSRRVLQPGPVHNLPNRTQVVAYQSCRSCSRQRQSNGFGRGR
jgi:hypothetical protein